MCWLFFDFVCIGDHVYTNRICYFGCSLIVCIGDHVYLEGPPPVCRCWAAVGPTAWFADVEPTLDRPLGLPTLSRRWTDRLVCRRWADVGPSDKITSDRQLMSPAGRRSDQRRSDSEVQSGCDPPLDPRLFLIGFSLWSTSSLWLICTVYKCQNCE